MNFFAQLLLTKEETPQIQKTAKIKSHLTLLTPRLAFGYLGLVLSFVLFEFFVVNPVFNPHLYSQREHLLLGIIIEAGSGSQFAGSP